MIEKDRFHKYLQEAYKETATYYKQENLELKKERVAKKMFLDAGILNWLMN